MSDFDLDLRSVEDQMDWGDEDESGQIVLGVLDGTTPPEEWIAVIEAGSVLVLAVEGDVNKLASGFASDVSELDGDLLQFRDFLLVTPDGVDIDRSRLA